MLVPGLKAAGCVVKLHETDSPFHQPPGEQALFAKSFRFRLIEAVEACRLGSFAVQAESLGGGSLHAIGQLKGVDPGTQAAVVGATGPVQLIETRQGIELAPLLIATDKRR